MSLFDKVKEMMSGNGGNKGSGTSRSGKQGRSRDRSGKDDKIDRAADRMQDMTGGRYDDKIDRGRDADSENF